ncbi:MAG: hypothetical protein ACE5FU_02450 [Nitrospinota bacterium]
MKSEKLLVWASAFALSLAAPAAHAGVKSSEFHGQFRVNSYHQTHSEDTLDTGSTSESRLRYRPTWDVEMDNGVKLHLQMNIGHIRDGAFNHRNDHTGGAPSFGLRHGMVTGPIVDGWSYTGGIVPVSDHFGDTLFSGDWDFNPLTYMVNGTVAGMVDVRVGFATVTEGATGDAELIFLDADLTDLGLGFSVYNYSDRSGGNSVTTKDIRQTYLGLNYSKDYQSVAVTAFALYNMGTIKKGNAAGKDFDNSGFAFKLGGTVPVGPAKIGIQGLYSSGDKKYATMAAGETDADSFITPMSIYGGHGYWGMTGNLTVQGPTDTGIDNPVRLDGGSYNNQNVGLGITTIQANVDVPVIKDKLSFYGAVGYFMLSDNPTAMADDVGTDIYAQLTYDFGDSLKLQAGGDFAALGEGHHMSNALKGAGGKLASDNVFQLFARFQLEY